ncbi:hypothetical protein GCM10023237_04220 [Streptomyces coeruleoprunus]
MNRLPRRAPARARAGAPVAQCFCMYHGGHRRWSLDGAATFGGVTFSALASLFFSCSVMGFTSFG